MSDASFLAASRRPLSPHLQVYRWSWTMAMSVVHRLTGLALYGGTLVLTVWLVALASGPEVFGRVQGLLVTPLGQAFLIAYSWTLLHHMLGGLRHFFWDMGVGYERTSRLWLARGTLIFSLLLTVVLWTAVYMNTFRFHP